jgi:fructokinase
MLIGGIVVHNSKIEMAVGDDKGQLIERIELSKSSPEAVTKEIVSFFKSKNIDSMGVSSSLPLALDLTHYGDRLSQEEATWANYDLIQSIKKELDLPIKYDTEANGALLGEITFGMNHQVKNCLYIKVNDSIQVGVMLGGQLLQNKLKGRISHFYPRRHSEDHLDGICPFHKDCLEGLATETAIEMRWSKKVYDLIGDPKIWEIEAYYLAQALMQYSLVYEPDKIILDGEIMGYGDLLSLVRRKTKAMINGYVQVEHLNKDIESYISGPSLGKDTAICGTIALALKD